MIATPNICGHEMCPLVRHVEKLNAPMTDHEAEQMFAAFMAAHKFADIKDELRKAFDRIVAERQTAGQFAAFDDPQLPLDP